MDWQTRLAERRETFPECGDREVPKVPEVGFGTSGTHPDGHFQNIAPASTAIRAHLIEATTAECADPELVHRLTTADMAGCDGLPMAGLRAYIRALADANLRERGRCPADETAPALCRHCGAVWLAPEVAAVAPVLDGWPRVLGCPWCHVKNRKAIPRPLVACGQCQHFTRDTVNPDGGMGRCTADREPLRREPMPYPHATRECESYAPA